MRRQEDRQTECINTFQLGWKVLKTDICSVKIFLQDENTFPFSRLHVSTILTLSPTRAHKMFYYLSQEFCIHLYNTNRYTYSNDITKKNRSLYG